MIKGMTGFDYYGAGDAPIAGFTRPFTQTVGPGRFSAGAGNWNPFTETADNRWALNSATNATPFIGFGWMYSVAAAEQVVVVADDSGTAQFSLTWNGLDQKFRVRAGYGLAGTVLGASTATTAAANTWHHVELIITVGDSGSVEIKFDGGSILVATGDTKASSTAQITHLVWPGMNGVGGNVLFSYDDQYVIDTSGAAPTASIGDCRVRLVRDTADGAHTDFTPSSPGTHFDKVNSIAGASYVSSATVGQKESYTFAALPLSSVIVGIQASLAMFKTDSGSRSVAPLTRVGSTDYEGTPISLSSSPKVYTQILGVNPATSAAWTPADFNAAQFGFTTKT